MIAEPVDRLTEGERERRRFTVAEFLRMDEVGLFGENERVELIQGEIIAMSPINLRHASTVTRLNWLLSRLLGDRALLGVQTPVQLTEDSLPQPDVVLLRPQPDFYSKGHPGTEDILLLIEVSDTTLAYDRRTKAILYAAAGIADYWIVNLQANVIEVYHEPRPTGYRTVARYEPGETLSPLAFADVTLAVSDVLGTSNQ